MVKRKVNFFDGQNWISPFFFPRTRLLVRLASRRYTTTSGEGEAGDQSRSSLQPCRRRGGGRSSRSSSSAIAGQSAHCPPHHRLGSACSWIPDSFFLSSGYILRLRLRLLRLRCWVCACRFDSVLVWSVLQGWEDVADEPVSLAWPSRDNRPCFMQFPKSGGTMVLGSCKIYWSCRRYLPSDHLIFGPLPHWA
jgi:hypothetical protein